METEERQSQDYALVYLKVNGCYFWFNILQITFSANMLMLLYWEMPTAALVTEILIAFMVSLELLFAYFAEGRQALSTTNHRINFLILTLLSFSIASDLAAPQFTRQGSGLLASGLLCLRYGVQVGRLCRLFFDSRKNLQISQQHKIVLGDIEEEHHEGP